MREKTNELLVYFISPAILILITLSFNFESSLPVIILSVILLILGITAHKKKAVWDVVLYASVAFITAPSLMLLHFYPEIVVFDSGSFQFLIIEKDTVNHGITLLASFLAGWVVVSIFDMVKKEYLSEINISDSTAKILIYWLMISIIATAAGALLFRINIAGIETELSYSGLYIYAFPADFLAIICALALSLHMRQFKRNEKFIYLLLIAYIVVKLMTGWKSPLLNVALSFIVGFYLTNRMRSYGKVIVIFLIVATLYILVVKPLVDIVRNVDRDAEIVSMYSSSLLSNRLTESNFHGLSLIQGNISNNEINPILFIQDFINRLVPGTLFDIKSVDRIFTEDILGQVIGIASTFAPGIVGTVELLGGGFAAFLYGFVVRIIICALVISLVHSNGGLGKLLILSFLPVFIVSLVIDGYTGGFERLIMPCLVVFTGRVQK